ncbi:MAG: hypothetical protein MZU95_01275 [Desulfomicrobium escambiense]|nr:hypothetical protein [Desulfomicrobium escambiense]
MPLSRCDARGPDAVGKPVEFPDPARNTFALKEPGFYEVTARRRQGGRSGASSP